MSDYPPFREGAIDAYCVAHSDTPSPLCEELAAFTRENVPYPMMLSGPQVGALLGCLIRSLKAKRVLEIGCYTGYSALAMAEQMPPEAELLTLDINPDTNAIARRFWDRSPHGKKIRSILAPASETLETLSGPFDFVFIDADKGGYIGYFERCLELLAPKGMIAVDNCLFSGKVLEDFPKDDNAVAIKAFNEHIRSRDGVVKTLLPIRDGVFLITKA